MYLMTDHQNTWCESWENHREKMSYHNTWSLQYPLSITDRTVRQKTNETGRNTIKQLDLTDMQSTTQKQDTRSSQVQVGHCPGQARCEATEDVAIDLKRDVGHSVSSSRDRMKLEINNIKKTWKLTKLWKLTNRSNNKPEGNLENT